MATVWITFATEDNVDGDIDYLGNRSPAAGGRPACIRCFRGEDEKIDRLMPAFLEAAKRCVDPFSARPRPGKHGRAARIEGAIQRALSSRGLFTA